MAELKYCPNCKTSRECTKKGFNRNGDQLWICKTCNKRFVPTMATLTAEETKAPEPTKKETIIEVNNNIIKTVPDLLTVDQAFDIASPYFREIVKDKVEVKETNSTKTIKFKISAGEKG